MKKAYLYLIFALIIIVSVIYGISVRKKRDIALKNNTVVIATITDIGGGRGPSTIYIEFKYNGKIVHGSFNTYETDSLGKNVKVKMLISRKFPERFNKYLGVIKN